jgi:hypothetical protein
LLDEGTIRTTVVSACGSSTITCCCGVSRSCPSARAFTRSRWTESITSSG